MKMFEVVFIPSPGVGHLRSTVQMAKLLVGRDERLSITVLIIPDPSSSRRADGDSAYITSLTTAIQDRLRYKAISVIDQPTVEPAIQVYMEKQKPQVRDAVAEIIDPARPDSPRLAGLVVDMFCISMIDVGNEFGVPTYMAYTSNATFLGVMLHVQYLYNEGKYDVNELEESVAEIEFPCFTRPYPVRCLPYVLKSKESLPFFLTQARYFRKMKGILVNTVAELETHSLKVLSNGGGPPIYPVGPVLHLQDDSGDEKQPEISRWLDEQPPSSVVFLCFGSMGAFNEEQIREIAVALERSSHRFLWSLRRASSNLLTERPRDFTNLEEVLPEGFLDRTVDRGRVIGWAPQVSILAKPAIGGFFTHCGWNSMLEGLWFGIPMATWPLYAEQQVNAFEMVEELGLAVAIKKYMRGDLMVGTMELVTAEEIERAVTCVMEQESDMRARVKEMAEKCHVAVLEGGSSSAALQKFIQALIENVV